MQLSLLWIKKFITLILINLEWKSYSFKVSSVKSFINVDVNAKKSGVAMTVNSGIDKEGKDIFGLAHFCEHMLFLGSKKYPKPAHFVDFVTQSGGKFNGFTEFDLTGFFFKINSDKLEPALDIFAQIFIDPLFSKEHVEKEVNSLNSEFERNIQMDNKRKEMVFREIADPESLFHRFSTGNKETLFDYSAEQDIDLRERVVDYYKTHYRPDNMKLIILGSEDFGHYKDLVEKYFENLEKPLTPYTPYKFSKWTKLPFEFHKLGKLVLYQTINTHQDLDISFMVPDIFDPLPANPALYYKFLLNHRGEGSLNDILREKGYVAGIKSNLRRTYKGWAFFKIKGYITHKGIQNLDKVIRVILSHLQAIKEIAKNPNLYRYVKRSFDLDFFFNNKNKKKFTKQLKTLCGIVWRYPKKYYLSQHKILPKDMGDIEKFGEYLVLNNAIIMVGNKSFDTDGEKQQHSVDYQSFVQDFTEDSIVSKQDPYYETKFSEYTLKKEFIKSVDNNKKFNKKLQLFSHKKSLPEEVSLAKSCLPLTSDEKKECLAALKKDGDDLTPKKISSNTISEMWYLGDRSFYMAKSNLYIRFIFNKDVNNQFYATHIRLLVFAFNHHLRNFFGEESLRQNSFEIKSNPTGFSVKIYSFTENLEETAMSLLGLITNLDLTKSEFDLIKDEMKTHIQKQMNLVPSLRAYVNFFKIIVKDYIEYETLIQELSKMTLKDFKLLYNDLFRCFYLKIFLHGTLDLKQAKDLHAAIISKFKPDMTVKEKSLIDYHNLHSDLSGYFIFREKLMNIYNINHAVLNIYQIGSETIQNVVNAKMVKALCGYIYFTELRIKERLGYTTKAKIFSEGGVIYYMIYIQGSGKTPDVMDLRIEHLLRLMRKRIEDTDEKKFNKFKEIIFKKLSKKDPNLKKRSIRYYIDKYLLSHITRLWDELINERFYFNIKDIAQENMESITKDAVLQFFDQMVKKHLSKLSVQEYSQKARLSHNLPIVRGYQSVKVKHFNDLRRKNKFLKHFKSEEKEDNEDNEDKEEED